MAPVIPSWSNYTTGGTSQWYVTNATSNWSAATSITITDDSTLYYSETPGERLDRVDGKLVVPKGRSLQLPDGTVLHVDDMGNVKLDDSDAKVIYQANRMREFNPYVNASDLLASFIRYCGSLGLGKEELGKLPIPLFINWLVIEAAKRDNDPIPDGVVPLEQHPVVQRLLPKMVAA